ncbi:beta-1,3-galactosyl-O-glycosyl-glycoprotein beta-1,6-N-acetylglucosaminyltransferase [Aplysia californica]|uniref:Beta-1,3-galactosyl-O-glycosyl-glycoprotein beta-1,6-N-acetylglucosaminyltransferase n=1 Tax=Aplysia californica TaxID=6500 RepID=A0ABM1VZH5_APLCA|nr:beta-1,3-galactosyl-O-glycosyl-glycoprotein beta-1,6-N-acetylglucosaminyltransferase [Aplysia californica]
MARHSFCSRLNHTCRVLLLSPLKLFLSWPRATFLSTRRIVLIGLTVTLAVVMTLTACILNFAELPEVRLVLSPGFPLHIFPGYTLPEVLYYDVTEKLPDDLQHNVAARMSMSRRGRQSVRLLSVPGRQPSCAALVQGDEAEVTYALQYMETVEIPREPSLSEMSRAPSDCDAYVKSRGYITHSVEQEREFPIAFSIMLYRDIDQVERLLRAIYRPHNVYCLHVDAKAEEKLQEAVRGLVKCLPNVLLASKQNKVDWAQFNSLTPWLYCMKDLWPSKWKYFINLTGQEFPLKSNLQLVQILRALNGSNVVDTTLASRYSRRWYSNFPAPDNIRPHKGLVFVVLSRGMVDYILHNPVAERFLDWVSRTDFPDETFFSSLNHNPHLNVPGSYKGSPETHAEQKPYIARFVNWGKGWKDSRGRYPFSWPCGGKRVRGVCIFGIRDLPLLTSRKELFANKFFADYQPLAQTCLEEWHFNMTLAEYSGLLTLNTSWYANMDIVRNAVVAV